MSSIEYTKCDGCSKVEPDNWFDASFDPACGWAHITITGRTYDLCEECARKAMEAVGVKV